MIEIMRVHDIWTLIITVDIYLLIKILEIIDSIIIIIMEYHYEC